MELVVQRRAHVPVHVLADSPLGVCARLMLQHRFRHLPVLDADNRPLGVLEDLDVFRHGALLGPKLELWLAFDPKSDRLRAADVFKPFAARCAPGTSTLLALHKLGAGNGTAVAVVDEEQRLVGLFTEHDAVVAARDLVSPTQVVGDIATRPARTVDWLGSAHRTLSNMLENGYRHQVVLRDNAFYGVVSARDLVTENVMQRRQLAVDDVMSAGPFHQVAADQSVREAAALMARERIGCLPVIGSAGDVVGIVTRTDLLEAAVAALGSADAFRGPERRDSVGTGK